MTGPRFWIGTSGWNYGHWRGLFYPQKLAVKHWFEFYSRHFPTVEINNTFYREPAAETYDRWQRQAPEGFRYAVKAHRYLTHLKRLIDPEDSLERVIKGARRLKEHMGPVLYQLPPYFKRTEEHAARLEAFLELLPGDMQHCVEFRDNSWWEDEATSAQLRRHNVAFCCHDSGGKETPFVATAGFAYVRFHGGSAHAGNYADSELRSYADRLERLAVQADTVYIYFNNDVGGHAITNAQTLARMLNVSPAVPV